MKNISLLFHVHTRASFDSMLSPRTILRYCRDHRIDAVAICDHDSFDGSRRAAAMARDYGVTVLSAVEIATDAGDIIGLFIDDMPPQRDVATVLKFIRTQPLGLAVLPHPMRGIRLSRIAPQLIDLVETGNARCSAAENDAAAAYAIEVGKPAIVGADAHLAGELQLATNTFQGNHDAADMAAWRNTLLTASRTFRIQRSPVRFRAMSGLIQGIKRRELGTLTSSLRVLTREEANRRLWRWTHREAQT